MRLELVIGIVGMFGIAAIAMSGRRKPVEDMNEWAVSNRTYGVLKTWILQAGETFTTFTFLGTIGLVVALGGAGFYSIPYLPLAYLIMYWIAPKLWRRGRDRGYLTQADFIEDAYNSKVLGTVCGIVGILILLPYIQLQIVGLSLIIDTATGSKGSGRVSAVIGFVLVIVFVLWAGLGGIARVSFFKDIIMIVVMIALGVAIPVASGHGFFGTIAEAATVAPESLYARAPNGPVWVITSMAVSMVGVMFYALPHNWPAVMASGSEKVVRQNLIFLPIYNLFSGIAMLLAYAFIIRYGMDAKESNGAMLRMAVDAVPPWALGIVLVAGAATAMVPAAGMLLSVAPLAIDNVLRVTDEAKKIRVTRIVVVVIGLGALTLALVMPNLLANMLLLTLSGSVQLVPAIACGLLMKKRLPHAPSILAGLIVGLAGVFVAEFTPAIVATGINSGLFGLPFNVLTIFIVEFFMRGTPAPLPPELRGDVPANIAEGR